MTLKHQRVKSGAIVGRTTRGRKFKEILAIALESIHIQATQNGDSPRAIARQLYGQGTPIDFRHLLSDHDPQTGDWADLSPDCVEYLKLSKWLGERLHDVGLPTLLIGFNTRKTKSDIAKMPRMQKSDSGKTVDDLIKRYRRREEIARELWDCLHGDMDEEGMSPKEVHIDELFSDKSRYQYFVNDKSRKITFGTFQKKLSKFRKQRG